MIAGYYLKETECQIIAYKTKNDNCDDFENSQKPKFEPSPRILAEKLDKMKRSITAEKFASQKKNNPLSMPINPNHYLSPRKEKFLSSRTEQTFHKERILDYKIHHFSIQDFKVKQLPESLIQNDTKEISSSLQNNKKPTIFKPSNQFPPINTSSRHKLSSSNDVNRFYIPLDNVSKLKYTEKQMKFKKLTDFEKYDEMRLQLKSPRRKERLSSPKILKFPEKPRKTEKESNQKAENDIRTTRNSKISVVKLPKLGQHDLPNFTSEDSSEVRKKEKKESATSDYSSSRNFESSALVDDNLLTSSCNTSPTDEAPSRNEDYAEKLELFSRSLESKENTPIDIVPLLAIEKNQNLESGANQIFTDGNKNLLVNEISSESKDETNQKVCNEKSQNASMENDEILINSNCEKMGKANGNDQKLVPKSEKKNPDQKKGNKFDHKTLKDRNQNLANENDQTVANENDQTLANENDQTLANEKDQSLANEKDQSLANENDQTVANENDQTLANEIAQTLANENDRTLVKESDQTLVNETHQTETNECNRKLSNESCQKHTNLKNHTTHDQSNQSSTNGSLSGEEGNNGTNAKLKNQLSKDDSFELRKEERKSVASLAVGSFTRTTTPGPILGADALFPEF